MATSIAEKRCFWLCCPGCDSPQFEPVGYDENGEGLFAVSEESKACTDCGAQIWIDIDDTGPEDEHRAYVGWDG